MKLIIFFVFFLSSCALQPKNEKTVIKKREPVSVDVAIQLARTGYIRSCIQAHKQHAPDKKWSRHCREEGEKYIKEIFLFLE